MAILDLPESILQSLSSVLTQLQQVLPAPKQPTDFSAIAFRWENQQLVAIQQPKALKNLLFIVTILRSTQKMKIIVV